MEKISFVFINNRSPFCTLIIKNYSRIPLFCNVSKIRNFQNGTCYLLFCSCFNISKEFYSHKKRKGYGIILTGGDIIIDPGYKKVDWKEFAFEDGSYERKMIFKCQADDEHYEIIKWDSREN